MMGLRTEKIYRRKIQEHSSALRIALPKQIANEMKLKPGSIFRIRRVGTNVVELKLEA